MTIELAEAWLDARGLDVELAAKMGWEANHGKDGGVWLKIPYVRDGKVINHKFRALGSKRFLNTPGAEHDLLNVDCLKDSTLADHPVVWVEGEMDWLAVLQCGFLRVISIPDGWTEGLENYDSQPKFEILVKNEQLLKGNTHIVAGDDDAPGQAFVRAVANFFDEDEVRAVRWPKGCKDPNDCLVQHGHKGLVEAINRAEMLDPPGGIISGFSDLPALPPRKIWRLDVPDFDRMLAFRSRELSVLTGVPGGGKTTFVTWCMRHLVRANDVRIGAILMESDYQSEILRHLHILDGGMTEEVPMETRERLDRNYRLVTVVESDDSDHGMMWLKRFIHKLAARDGCNVIVIDPWNELEHMPEPGESMTNYINFALKKLRQWAARYDIHIMIVAHPRKLQNGERPTGYSIADSAGFFNKAGMGWSLSPEKDADHGEHVVLKTWKVRNRHETGCRPSSMRMIFDEHAMVYRKWRPHPASAHEPPPEDGDLL